MNAVCTTLEPRAAAGISGGRMAGIYVLESWYEFLKLLRLPGYSIPTIVFPVFFYVIFALSFGSGRAAGPVPLATYLIATYGTFGVIGASLFAFGIGVAIERGQGWMLLKRATPMPPMAYFTAKLVMSLIFSSAIVALLSALGVMFGGVSMSFLTWLALCGILISGAVPFCALGLTLGYWTGPNSAAPIANILYLPMAFLSGLWIPVEMLPPILRSVAPYLPPYHLAQLALGVIGAGRGGSNAGHVAVLAGFTVLCLAAAYGGFRRDEGKTYG
jgi:ABC-2 type transport system permease protein